MNSLEQLRYLVLAAQREGNKVLLNLLRPHGVTPAQAEVLRVVADHGPLSLVELGTLLVCENGSPSRLVDGLVSAELLDRIPAAADRRRVILTLTDSGRAKEMEIRGVEKQLHSSFGLLLGEADVDAVNEVLRTLVAGRPAGDAVALRAAASDASVTSHRIRSAPSHGDES